MSDIEKKPNAQLEFLKGLFGADGTAVASENAVLDAIAAAGDGDTTKALAFRRVIDDLRSKGLLKIEYALTGAGRAHIECLEALIEVTRSDSGAFNPYSTVDVQGLTARVYLDEASRLLNTSDPADVRQINERLRAGEPLEDVFTEQKS